MASVEANHCAMCSSVCFTTILRLTHDQPTNLYISYNVSLNCCMPHSNMTETLGLCANSSPSCSVVLEILQPDGATVELVISCQTNTSAS